MSWLGPELDEDQRDLAALLDALADRRDTVLDDEPAEVASLIEDLVRHGIWTLGTRESDGGAGAGRAATAIVWERLGRNWPALGWAAVQAHAAVDVLAADPARAELIRRVHSGSAAVAVVDAASARVRLEWHRGRLTGSVDRVDVAAQRPHLLVLTGVGDAVFVPAESMRANPLRRTGLGGALTCSLRVDAEDSAVHRLTGIDADAARVRLWLGAAAVAAGIAGAAVDAATAYTRTRRQFGAALTAIPTVRQSLLDQAGRTVLLASAALTAPPHPVPAAAAAREACDSAIAIAADALQSHGGYGYLTEYAAERHLRDAVSLRAAVDTSGAGRAAARMVAGLEPVEMPDREAS